MSDSRGQPINMFPSITKSACKLTTSNEKPSYTFDKVFQATLDVNMQDIDLSDFCDEDLQYCNTEMQKTITHDNHDKQENKEAAKKILKAVKNVKPKEQKTTASSHGDVTAQRPILANIYPSTSNSNREIHWIPVVDSLENINTEEENVENQSVHLEHTCEKCRQQYSLRFSKIERKLNRILHFLENPKEVQNEVQNDFSLLPNFPLSTVQEVQNFNNQLEDNNVRLQFVSMLLVNYTGRQKCNFLGS